MHGGSTKRRPAVAGQFYGAARKRLEGEVRKVLRNDVEVAPAIGLVAPHAGLMYSGAVAGEVYSRVDVPETVILLGPNHTGLGAPLSVMSFGSWEIPTGTLEIDSELAERLLEYVDPLHEDEQAHVLEHSLELQLPFIVERAPTARIVPIAMGDTSLETCRALGEGAGEAIREMGRPILIVASSDMSHYVSDAEARVLDRRAIDRVLELDAEGLHRVVRKERITMCGYGPVTAMLYAARVLGARDGELVAYQTSGDVSGDRSRVVGYAGIVIR